MQRTDQLQHPTYLLDQAREKQKQDADKCAEHGWQPEAN